jgi:hypothetical protein
MAHRQAHPMSGIDDRPQRHVARATEGDQQLTLVEKYMISTLIMRRLNRAQSGFCQNDGGQVIDSQGKC